MLIALNIVTLCNYRHQEVKYMATHKISQDRIAKELHISRNTVSKVFNKASGISDKTRSMVLSKAFELGYTHINPELFDESSIKASNGSISLVCHDNSLKGSFWTKVLRGIEMTLREKGFILRITIINDSDEETNNVPDAILSDRPSGLIMIGLFQKEYYLKIRSLNIPMITMDTAIGLMSPNMICDVILMENAAGVYALTKDLIQKGYKDIAFVGEADSCVSMYERWQGYCTAMKESGLDYEMYSHLSQHAEMHYYYPSDVKDALQKCPQAPAAFVCANDLIANTIKIVANAKDGIDENAIVTGFDNIDECAYLLSKSSTVEIFAEELGTAVSEQIIWRLENKHSPFRTIRIDVKPIFRG